MRDVLYLGTWDRNSLPEVTLLNRLPKNWFADVNIYVLVMTESSKGSGTKPRERNLESEVAGKSVSWECLRDSTSLKDAGCKH